MDKKDNNESNPNAGENQNNESNSGSGNQNETANSNENANSNETANTSDNPEKTEGSESTTPTEITAEEKKRAEEEAAAVTKAAEEKAAIEKANAEREEKQKAEDRKKKVKVLADSVHNMMMERATTNLPQMCEREIREFAGEVGKTVEMNFHYSNAEKTKGHIIIKEFDMIVRCPGEQDEYTFGIDYQAMTAEKPADQPK